MWRKIAALMALWCVLVIVPALIGARLLDEPAGKSSIGWIAGIWIAGYLCQFVLFIMIGRRSPCGTALGRVLAAIVPWLADWTALVSPWFVLPTAAIVIGYSAVLTRSVYQVDVLRRDGVEAAGVVLEVIRPALNVVIDNIRARRTMHLRVERLDGTPPYAAQFTGIFMLGEIPEPGDTLVIRVDPAQPQHIELIENEPILRASTNVPDLPPATAARLHRLTMMRDRGDLTDEEFATAKSQLF